MEGVRWKNYYMSIEAWRYINNYAKVLLDSRKVVTLQFDYENEYG